MVSAARVPPATTGDDLLASLDPEQRAAATLPDGPALVIAPAGSGKTTTLVARLGVLLARGVPAERIAVATFNRDAAIELAGRIERRLVPRHPAAARIEVRTLHALARQIVLDARGAVPLVADRLPLLRAVLRRAAVEEPDVDPQDADLPEPAALDTEISAHRVEDRPPEHPRLVAAYRALLAARGAYDFDDLVAEAASLLETNPRLRLRWQGRFSHVCVDEFQDVDAGQLRLVRLLAEPERNIFVVGDDDQTIYAWRLADVRRILGFGAMYPGARRLQLATNYRCPPPVVDASRRLVEVNRERYAKRILAGTPPSRTAGAIAALATTAPDWPDRLAALAGAEATAGETVAFLARTRTELEPILLALVRAGIPHASGVPAPIQAEPVQRLVDAARARPGPALPFDVLLELRRAHGWRRADEPDAIGEEEHAALDALLGWTVGFRRLDAFLAAHDEALTRIATLRRADALVTADTVHAAKGREWQTVIVLGVEEDRFPNRRALVDAVDPRRALEEERRLAYVAFTRATRRLVLAYDPARPSRFLVDAGLLTPGRGAQRPTAGATTDR